MKDIILFMLVIALVGSNVIWLVFIRGVLDAERSERWQLQERIREPEGEHIPIGALINQHTRKPVEPDPAEPVFTDEKPEDEYDLVGQVNPNTPLREDSE